MKVFRIVLVCLGSLAVGVLAGWLVARQPATSLHLAYSGTGVNVFTYYVDNRGSKIQHGWEFDVQLENGTRHVTKKLFDRGVLVSISEGMEYKSEWESDPTSAPHL
jgi:hypothetical protein